MIKLIEQLYSRIYSIARPFGKPTVKRIKFQGRETIAVYVNGRCDETKLRRAAFGQAIDRLNNGRIRVAVVIA